MSRKRTIDLNRRQVLRGAGGFSLAIPFMPSLAVKTAYGADPKFAASPRLIWFPANHGSSLQANMFPDPSMLKTTMTLPNVPDHAVSSGPLVPTADGGKAVLSPMLTADSSALTTRMAGNMNVLFGLDLPYSMAHGGGHQLGNYADNVGVGEEKKLWDIPAPTIDQICAYSPSFYRNLAGVPVRAIVTDSNSHGYDCDYSWNWANPSEKSGPVKPVPRYSDPAILFDDLFANGIQSATKAKRPPIINLVLDSYSPSGNS